jgi:hypothetical protein
MTRDSARGKTLESFHAIASVGPEITIFESIDVMHAGKQICSTNRLSGGQR